MMASNCNIVKDDLEFLNVNLNMKLLKPLDEILRCRICFDYFNNCMITKCSHNYCSVCIRRYMLYKSQCPTCFQEASEPELRNNRLIDEILHVYRKMKESIENTECITQEEKCKADNPVPIKIKKEILTADEDVQGKSERKTEKDNEVSCPVCYQRVSSERINIHLDACLKAVEKEQVSERRFLPKLVYHLLSDKEIKKKLKEQCLNTAGDRQSLIRRHKNFVVLHNANCDSLDPKPVTDLIREIEEQELEERLNSLPRQTQVHKKSDMAAIEKEHASHVQKHQSQFNALIHDVQQRELNRIVKQGIYDDYSESSESIIGNRADHFSNVTREEAGEGIKSSEHISIPSHQSTKTTRRIQNKDDRSEPISKKGDKDIVLLPSKDIKQEFDSPLQEKDDEEFFKSKEKIEDSLTSDSPSPIDDREIDS